VASEVEKMGKSWEPLQAGLFGGSLEKFIQIKDVVDGLVAEVRHKLFWE
jgi:hypothetical protein